MPLILAIESDKRQAAQLSAIARNRLKAEIVLADSAERALHSLGDRIPDLILTPALLSPRDENAITEHLRRLDSKASHVQTLTIPLLATTDQQGGRGMLGSLRKEKTPRGAADGCDPAVFAEQVHTYLERAATELEERRRIQELREREERRNGREGQDGRERQDTPDGQDGREPLERREGLDGLNTPERRDVQEEQVPNALRDHDLFRRRVPPRSFEPPRRQEEEKKEDEPLRPDVQDWQAGWKVVALDEIAEDFAAAAPAASTPEVTPVAPAAPAAAEPVHDTSRTASAQPMNEAVTEIDLASFLDEPAAPAAAAPTPSPASAPSPEAAIMAAVAAVERLLQPNAAAQRPVTVQPTPQPIATTPSVATTPPVTTTPPVATTPSANVELRLPSIAPEPAPGVTSAGSKRVAATTEPLPTMKTTAQPPKKKVRKPKPLQDEWGLFDPAQCGIAALVARLEDEKAS